MKSNIFKIKEKKDKRIIIEEERSKNPFLLFFKKNKNIILLILITFLICSLLASVGIVFSMFQGSNDYDITYIDGSEIIDSNNDPDIGDEEVKDELLGEIAREEGTVLLVESFMSPLGDVISYYTDGTTVITQTNGKTYRVSPKKNGTYNVNRNGKIETDAKKVLVEQTTTTLPDGTVITNYTDGSAKVQLRNQAIFVRDSNNIVIDNGTTFLYTKPSGVALSRNITSNDGVKQNLFTDKTSLVDNGQRKVVVNKNAEVYSNENNILYDKYNSFAAISEKKYKDGNTITHYANGSATITDSNGNVIYVKKSGDLVLKSKKLYEIIPNKYAFSRTTIQCADGKKVTYFDNGAAVVIFPDGKRQYVEDSDEIIYDQNKNIVSLYNFSKQISHKVTVDDYEVFNFENGKSQVIKKDGSSYIIDTSKLQFKPTGEIVDDPTKDKPDEEEPKEEEEENDPGAGIYISEAENIYNDFKNVEDTTFIIRNDNTKRKILRIVIQEVSDYRKYNTSRLASQFVKFQATVGDNYVPASKLNSKPWVDEDGRS